MTRSFRFGVHLPGLTSRSDWEAKVKQAEDLGYDVILVPDHLNMAAPFPALVAAANATGLQVGTDVLNTGFYRPALLARDVADTYKLTDGRLELGLGAGYVEEEFAAAELPFPSPGQRLANLKHTVAELRRWLDPMPPLMISGAGPRLLRFAAREADIVGLTVATVAPGEDPQRTLADRVELVREAAGDRMADIELNLFMFAVAISSTPDFTVVRKRRPELTEEQVRSLPGVLIGTEQEVADTLLRYRDTLGLTYFGVLEPHMVDFAKIISRLR